MSKLNDYKMAELASITGKPVGTFSIPDMEVDWLKRVRGRAGNTLNELWKQEFFAVTAGAAKLTMAYDDCAMLYLKTLGLVGETLPELWLDFWNGNAPVGINVPDLTLTAGSGSGNRVGYVRGNYGSISPDLLTDGSEIRKLFVNNNNGRLRFTVENEYPVDDFTTITIVGQGTLLTADAQYDWDGNETEWMWMNTGFSLVDGTVYVATFT